jgi:hypothetical protein
MKDYLVDGKAKIPTFVFMDSDYNVIDTFFSSCFSIENHKISTP